MLILPQMVQITLNSNTIKHFEEKGYKIPKRYSKKNKFAVPTGTKIIVDVLDLQERSGVIIKTTCDYCGKEHKMHYCDYISVINSNIPKISCYDCRGNKVSITKTKYTIEIIRQAFEEKNWILLSTEYEGYTKHLYYICENGHECKITFKDFLNGHGCKKCATKINADKQRYTLEEVQNIFIDGGCLLLSTEYNNAKQKLKYICSCGNDKAEINLSHFKSGERCMKCGIEKTKLGLHKYDYWFVKKTFEEYGCMLLSTTYEDTEQSLEYLCKCGEKSKIKFHNFLSGQRCRKCFLKRNSGINHWKWNSNLTKEDRTDRRMTRGYISWRKAVRERDNYTCQCCGDNKGGNLNAHHINSYNWSLGERLNINNGITLCNNCHSYGEFSFHKIYGFGNNTRSQFETWITNKKYNVFTEVEKASVFILSKEVK